MKMVENNFKNQRGFTMIEVISVLIIIGILAAVVIIRMTNTREYDLSSQVEVIKNHLRLAQSRAMGTGSPWGINFNTATTYYLFQGIESNTPIHLVGEKSNTIDLTEKKSSLTVTPTRITFDAHGSPGSNTINLVTNAGNITITKNTGFIP
jgi:MSHA pilin protein MshC